MSKIEKLHFKLRGEDLTRIVRDLVLEEDWEHAIATLVTGLHGMTHDFAYAVLSGKKKLTGDETAGIGLEDEDQKITEKQQKAVDYLYSCYFWYAQKWYKPYAVVTSFGICDLREFGTFGMYDSRATKAEKGTRRGLYYANDKYKDLSYAINSEIAHIALFEHVANPPIWMTEQLRHNTPQMAYDAYVNTHHSIEERGAQYDEKTQAETKWLMEGSEIRQIADEKIIEHTKWITPVDLDKLQDIKWQAGWILPDGRFYGCNYNGHIDLCDDIFHVLLGVDYTNPEEEAEKLGWLKIGFSMIGKQDTYFLIKKDITQAQRDKLFDWCKDHNEKYPANMEDLKY